MKLCGKIVLLLLAIVFATTTACSVITFSELQDDIHTMEAIPTAVVKPDADATARLSETYGKLPLIFEANHDQTDAQVKFLSRGSGYTLFLTPTEAVLTLSKPATSTTADTEDTQTNEHAVLRMQLVGANPEPDVMGVEELPGKSNYFIGNDPNKWHTNVPHYAKVRYQQVYPGVGLVYYGSQRQLEYDLVVAPGADPASIRLRFDGAKEVTIDDQGNLILHIAGGEVIMNAPAIYQDIDGVKKAIPGEYVFRDKNQVGFRVGNYDASRPLVIDPILAYSTYLGGSGGEPLIGDVGNGVAVDSSGNAYVTGLTPSTDFPTASPFQLANAGGYDAFVTKLNADGSALVYSTYLGGSGTDFGNGIALDADGNAYVTGTTGSADFPTASPFQGSKAGHDDAFVTKLNGAGSALVYSTYFGGTGEDRGNGIALDASGNAYVTGTIRMGDSGQEIATQGAFQESHGNGTWDAFVMKLNPTGSALVYSTYLGGEREDRGKAIAVDTDGNAYVTGMTTSHSFPTTAGAFQTTIADTICCPGDAFVTKLNVDGSALVYSTYLGSNGGGADFGNGIALDADGNAYVTGHADTWTFPTTEGAFKTYLFGGGVFVTKLNPAGSSLIYSTFLGGGDGYGVTLDGASNAYVTGTGAADFPTTPDAFQTTGGGVFVTILSPAGSALVCSTLLGTGNGRGIGVDASGNAYVTGHTNSVDFPTTAGAFQPTFGGNSDAFVVKIVFPPTIAAVPTMTLWGGIAMTVVLGLLVVYMVRRRQTAS